jgi:hypothetical protein
MSSFEYLKMPLLAEEGSKDLSYQSRRDAERIVAENLAANHEKDQFHMLK